MTTATAKLVLPVPHRGQIQVLASPARFKVCVWGRRGGKTMTGIIAAIAGHGPLIQGEPMYRGILQGAKIGWFGPTYPITSDAWRDLKLILGGSWANKNEAERIITMPGGGTLQVISVDDPDAPRGKGFDGVVPDEAAMYAEVAWTAAIRPTLADTQGWALFLTTSRLDGLWFDALYEQAGTRPDWARWQFPTSINPAIPPEEIEDARRTLPDGVFRREFLGEFVTSTGIIFRSEWERYFREEGEEPNKVYALLALAPERVPTRNCVIFQTIDLALSVKQTADYTVISTWAVTPQNKLLLLDVVRGRFEGPTHLAMVQRAYQQWRPGFIGIGKGVVQLGLVQEMQRAGLPVRECPEDKDKLTRALTPAQMMANERVFFRAGAPWLDETVRELVMFQGDGKTPDDFVDTFSMAAREVALGRVMGQAQERTIIDRPKAWVV